MLIQRRRYRYHTLPSSQNAPKTVKFMQQSIHVILDDLDVTYILKEDRVILYTDTAENMLN